MLSLALVAARFGRRRYAARARMKRSQALARQLNALRRRNAAA